MADARVTQEVIHALTEAPSNARATQIVVLALGAENPPARVTQLPIHALCKMDADARITQLPILVLAKSVPELSFRSMMWKITRTDGEIFLYTDHDVDFDFRGETYRHCKSLQDSAVEMGSIIGSTGNLEISGMITDEDIKEEDLFMGLFDGAEVEIWSVPWINTTGEFPHRVTFGRIGKISQGDTSFKAEALTQAAQLEQQALLKYFTPGCRWQLGDVNCGVDLTYLRVGGAVTAVPSRKAHNQSRYRIFTDSGRPEASRYFEHGLLTWTTGLNTGISSEVKDFGSGEFILWNQMLHEIQIGDQYEVVPGCGKTETDCTTKFNNFERFGGFPHLPGRDALVRTPNSKA